MNKKYFKKQLSQMREGKGQKKKVAGIWCEAWTS